MNQPPIFATFAAVYAQAGWTCVMPVPTREKFPPPVGFTGAPSPEEFCQEQPVVLYRHFDRNGELLYIGITSDPVRRWGQHLEASPWARLVSDVTVHWLDSREKALAAERRVIGRERPLFNRARPGNPPWERRQSIAVHQRAYLRTGVSGLWRWVRCKDEPTAFCISCGPDADAWLDASYANSLARKGY